MIRVSRFLVLAAVGVLVACGGGEGEGAPEDETWEGDIETATRALRPQGGTEFDWGVFHSSVTYAWEAGFDTLPMGEAMVRIGESFVGWPYGPGTLEVAGEEDVVINFEEFDCVTLVENVLALARFVKTHDSTILASDLRAREAYKRAIQEIRYRRGRVDGYPSRLHYFSEWISDNEAKGLVKEVTQELGGEEDSKAIDFMSTHPEAYRQLADPANVRAIMDTEFQLSGMTRFRIPEGEISILASSIQNGDIIAATSTVDGLDVAHTGLAYWQGTELHLLHAPLVGESVEVSRLPLGERILRLTGQDGIRVARPQEVSPTGGSPTP